MSKGTILVVDDDAAIRDLVQMALGRRGLLGVCLR